MTRPARFAATALVLAALTSASAGCGGDAGDDRANKEPDADRAPGKHIKPRTGEEEVIRNWVRALNRGDFEMAARYFAPGAVVQQATETTLRDDDAAVEFNRSLPCRADVTDFEDEGRATLAAFRLRKGRRGQCVEGGRARVRFVIDGGLIKEWRQLPERNAAPGGSA